MKTKPKNGNFDHRRFCDEILQKRYSDNVTLMKLAAITGISFSQVQRLETSSEKISLANAVKLCNWLGKPISAYLTK